MIYDNNKYENKIKIFDEEFVKNNKDNYYMIIENKIMNIEEYYWINKENKMKNLKIVLLKRNNVIDMSYMFCECSSLSSLPDISKWNTNNVTNMSEMFYNCSSLSSLPDISK